MSETQEPQQVQQPQQPQQPKVSNEPYELVRKDSVNIFIESK